MQKEDDKAMQSFQGALELHPSEINVNANAYNGMGGICSRRGDYRTAMEYFEKAIHFQPNNTEALCNRACLLAKTGRIEEAISEFRRILQLYPNCSTVFSNLGSIYANLGHQKEAIPYFEKAVDLSPNDATAHNNLAKALVLQERYQEARKHYYVALKLDPGSVESYNHQAMLLSSSPEASVRNGEQAVALAQQAVRLSNGQDPISFDALASAYAETGQFHEAVQTLQKAIDLATQQNRPPLAKMFSKKLQLFQAGTPYRLSPAKETVLQLQP
jgi:tetratricopeptide (TPR) repeat protein